MDQLRAAASADLVSISKEMDMAIKDLQEQLAEAKGLHQVGQAAARLHNSGVGSHTWILVLGTMRLWIQPLEPCHLHPHVLLDGCTEPADSAACGTALAHRRRLPNPHAWHISR
jgi:hypothetical protein